MKLTPEEATARSHRPVQVPTWNFLMLSVKIYIYISVY